MAGYAGPAIEHLRRAIELNEKSRLKARTDPNFREAYLKGFLEDMGLTVEMRPWIDARRYDFSSSRLVVYTEDLRIGTDTHTKIIDQGLGLALFYTAGIGSGGNWYSNWAASGNWWVMTCSPGGGYLEGYTGMSFQVMDERQTFWRSSNTPPGWNFAAYNNYNSGYRTSHWRENTTSGGHGGVLGFDVRLLNDDGREMARAMIEWCLDGQVDQRIVGDRKSVLIIRSTDTITPTLNDLESAANDLLRANGLSVVYVAKSQIGTTDLTRANGVYLVEGLVTPTLVNQYVSAGLHVGLMYTGSNDFGGSWTWHDHRHRDVDATIGALDRAPELDLGDDAPI